MGFSCAATEGSALAAFEGTPRVEHCERASAGTFFDNQFASALRQKDDKPWVLPLLGQQIRRYPLSGDSSVNLFVGDSLRQSGTRFCHLHGQRPPITA